MRILFPLFTLLLMIAPNVQADIADIKGIATDQPIPHNLELMTQAGEATSFDQLKGERGLVLVFVRSVDWCPYCQTQLIELNAYAEKFNEIGYNIAALSYDRVDDLGKFAEAQNIDFTLLSDPASDAIRAFDLLNGKYAPGTRAYGVPYPAVYVIDAEGEMTRKFSKEGYKDRPSAEDILGALE